MIPVVQLPQETPCGPVKGILSGGISGFVGAINDKAVCKFARPNSPTYLQDILKEIKVYKRLGKHKNLLTFYGEIENGLVLERAHSLDKLTSMQCLDLLDVVKYIHSKGIVHCDINPNNVLVDDDGVVKLIDFASASVDGGDTMTYPGEEYYDDSLEYPSKEADMFALNQTIFKMCGKHIDELK
ncbi:hypothetical protein IWW36_004301 [Coemansia brasiliensis]|uniref:Protein kinase domain-containing protein n=1 Tax=Coemansia brasiliensis TaxID=2650707 RepID=A0A9W8LXQ6_9FUNG|nr:hypothetical protein IWW36_004301 [Coemansia brasiliensis]